MPIYLPAISRRRFLATTLTAAAGALCAPSLLAARRKTDADTWAFLSDIHISADPKKVARNTNMTDNLKAVRKEILSWPTRPSGLLVNGDLAFNSGESVDYAAVTKLFDPIRKDQIPVWLGIGNHDNRERFWDSVKSAKKTQTGLADRQVMMISNKHANFFVLDSLIETLKTPGLVGEEQREWLKKTLDANADKPAIIIFHHNPVESGMAANLNDEKEMFEILRPRKQVKAWFFGHTHFWNTQQDESGIHLVNLPCVAYPFKPEAPSGWVHSTLKPEGMRLELRCVDKTHKQQGDVKDLKWRV
ncbi:MAG: Metallophosphoesterase [Verrucomicrobiales bacterium]|nr:Metallophosphoesterase [Verrucomicrobiales bacterium]